MKHWVGEMLLCFSQAVWALGASDAQFTLRITDGSNNVVTNALVKIDTLDYWKPGTGFGKDIMRYERAVTDTNGMATLTIVCKNGKIGYGIDVDAYPHSHENHTYQMNGGLYYYGGGGTYYPTNKVKGKWQPWNPTLEVTAKRVINPIPMYAMRVSSGFKLLNSDDRPAFDLVKGDWVKPYGNGEVADFIFSVEYRGKTVTNLTDEAFNAIRKQRGESMARQAQRLATKSTYVMKFEMAFSNEDDGIHCLRVPPRQGSMLRLPYFAPDSGYDPVLKQEIRRNDGDRNEKKSFSEDLNYFFRVRTRKNDRREIVSALYGKIYGPVEFRIEDEFSVQFTYYLNPEPNDRNTEFDTKRNLLPSSRSTWNLLP